MSLHQVLLDYVGEACDQLRFPAPENGHEQMTFRLRKGPFLDPIAQNKKDEDIAFFISASNRIIDEVIDSDSIDLRGVSVDGWFAVVENSEWQGETGKKEFRLAWLPPAYVSDLASLLQMRFPRSLIRHTTCDLYMDDSDEEGGLGQMIASPPLRLVKGSGMELVKLFLMTAVPWEDKAGSILVHLFPYIQEEASSRSTSYTVDEYYQLLGLVKSETTQSDRAEKTARALSVAGMACLLHSWNIKDKVKNQLLRRVNAMAASLNIPPLKEEDLSKYMDNAGYASAKNTGWLTDLTGMIVARNNNWIYDLDTTVTQLGDPSLAKMEHGCTDLAVASLIQMRLVFAGFQTATARFTATLYQLMKSNQVTVTPTLRSDFEYFETIYKRIVNAPYCGVCARPPDAFQIRLYPRLAYSALLYHGKQLTAESAKKDWDKYSIKEISAHIGTISEKSVCEYFVQTLPSSFLYALAELIETMPFQDAEIAVSTLTAVQKDQLYSTLTTRQSQGAWYKIEKAKQEEKEYARLWSKASDSLEALYRKQSDAIKNAILTKVNAEERVRLAEAHSKWENRLISALRGQRSVKEMIEAEVNPMYSSIATKITESIEEIEMLIAEGTELIHK